MITRKIRAPAFEDWTMPMYRLTCATRDYAWGSSTLIPRFLDNPATGHPQAELWIGAHPGDPSLLPDGQRLDDFVLADPQRALGDRVAGMFGPRLPFLMKALAAAEPLSLQVHPTSERARLGHALEQAAGMPAGSADRSYHDEFHKPELIFAVTRFEGMAGFRDVESSVGILRLLDLPWADQIAERLVSGPAFQALHSVVSDLLATPHDQLGAILTQIGEAARGAEERSHRGRRPSSRLYLDRTAVQREATRLFAQTAALAAKYPADPGVLVTLLLNHVVLAPGEAMFLDAGVVHAYTSGFGIEIMASSDNVVRAGLTPKHVDVDELLHIANFTPMPPPIWAPTELEGDLRCFAPPVDEFALYVGQAPFTVPVSDGPRLVLCLDGEVEVASPTGREVLARGVVVFASHDEGELTIIGDGRVAVGVVPV
jgi:mannose-6-phosphate isomerase